MLALVAIMKVLIQLACFLDIGTIQLVNDPQTFLLPPVRRCKIGSKILFIWTPLLLLPVGKKLQIVP